jgi:hypothetical protein
MLRPLLTVTVISRTLDTRWEMPTQERSGGIVRIERPSLVDHFEAEGIFFGSVLDGEPDDCDSTGSVHAMGAARNRRDAMSSKMLVAIAVLAFSAAGVSQVNPAGERNVVGLDVGGGMDYWWGDWGGAVKRFGPAAWATADVWHGIGIGVEGHSMILGGGGDDNADYKYFGADGGIVYTYHRWRTIRSYAKGEAGFASLSFPPFGVPYRHQDQGTWLVGGGLEYRTGRHFWTRLDYSYTGFPNFFSPVSGKFHTLDPSGFSIGGTYHFR